MLKSLSFPYEAPIAWKNANIFKIYQLVNKTEAEMLKTKNFGRKSLNEIREVLNEMDLSLGMKLHGFVPPEEDIAKEEQSIQWDIEKQVLN